MNNQNTKLNVSLLTLRVFIYTLIAVFLGTQSAYAIEAITYYHHDALGSPVAATNEAGQLKWREDYQPYGERIRKPTNATENNLWYTGKPEEPELGLQYFGARWYDPQLGRFTGIDPVEFNGDIHTFNRYAYAANNPYKYVDPDGRFFTFAPRANETLDQAVQRGSPGNAAAVTGGAGAVAALALYFGGRGASAASGMIFMAAPRTTIFTTEMLASEVGITAGVVSGYTKFQNLRPTDAIGDAITFASSQIQKVSYSGKLNYIVSESGELVLGRTRHTSLSQGADVLAAGEVKFVDGVVKWLNNASGHYQPKGSSAKEAAEAAFEKAGFSAKDKYNEKF